MKGKKLKLNTESYLIIFTSIIFIALFTTTKFGTVPGINNFLKDISYLLIASTALFLVILTGNIDLSAGTMLGLCGYMAAYVAKMGFGIVTFLPVAILTGVVLSGINGIIVTKFKVPSLVATLAMVNVHLGLFILLPQGGWVEGLGKNFTAFGSYTFFGWMPAIFIFSVVVFTMITWMVKKHPFGKQLYATGGNEEATRLAGINPDKVVFKVFLLEGVLIGIASILFYTPKSVVQSNATYGAEMLFVAAVVVGGTRITGGKGSVTSVGVGVALITIINRAMIFLGMQDYYSYVTQGIIILLALLISNVDYVKIFKKYFVKNKLEGNV